MSESWQKGTLSDLADANPDKASVIRGLERFRYIDISCLSETGLAAADSIPVIDARTAPSRAQRLVKYGDSLVGTVRPERGARGLVGADLHCEVASSGICVLRPKVAYDAVFVYAVVRSPSFTEWCVNHSTGTSYPAVDSSSISSFPLLIPSLSERRRIAEVIGALDNRISHLIQLSLSLEEELQELFNALVDSDSQDVTLAQIALVNPHMAISGGSEASYVPMERVSTSGYRIKSATPRVVGSGARFRNGDTLVARITPSLENGKVGFVDLLHSEEVGWGSTEFIVLRGKNRIDPFIPYLIARSDGFRDYAVRHMSGSSGRQRCPAEAVERYRSLVPSDDGLARFASDSAPRREALKRFNDEAQMTRKLRNMLLPRLMSGDFRVAYAEDLVEAAT